MSCCAGIQAKIWAGYNQAAEVIGQQYQVYRPHLGAYPGLMLFSRPVALNAEDMKFSKPNKYGKATWYALMDGTALQAGDYLTGPQGTFFIAALQQLLPILVVECNRTITLLRATHSNAVGAQDYSGLQTTTETAFASAVPCSILQAQKGDRSDPRLAADTNAPWWAILLPASVGTVNYSDIITDDLGRSYTVSSAELTDLGYRLTAAQATV